MIQSPEQTNAPRGLDEATPESLKFAAILSSAIAQLVEQKTVNLWSQVRVLLAEPFLSQLSVTPEGNFTVSL